MMHMPLKLDKQHSYLVIPHEPRSGEDGGSMGENCTFLLIPHLRPSALCGMTVIGGLAC